MTSSSTPYQGLQSCVELTLVEPRVLMNKLPPPISNFLQMSNLSPQEAETEEENGLQNQHENSGWSFINEVENPWEYPKKGDEEVYVHPTVKSSCLNTKSLEMCTESLGSETGSEISEELCPNLMSTNFQRSKSQKINRASSFPPPLTSMSGNEGVQVRRHREGGRLVLKAVKINSYLQAERADGRLRLSLLTHDECSIEEDDDEITKDEICSRKLASHDIGVGGEYARASRCKATEIPSWEPFWVAIS